MSPLSHLISVIHRLFIFRSEKLKTKFYLTVPWGVPGKQKVGSVKKTNSALKDSINRSKITTVWNPRHSELLHFVIVQARVSRISNCYLTYKGYPFMLLTCIFWGINIWSANKLTCKIHKSGIQSDAGSFLGNFANIWWENSWHQGEPRGEIPF